MGIKPPRSHASSSASCTQRQSNSRTTCTAASTVPSAVLTSPQPVATIAVPTRLFLGMECSSAPDDNEKIHVRALIKIRSYSPKSRVKDGDNAEQYSCCKGTSQRRKPPPLHGCKDMHPSLVWVLATVKQQKYRTCGPSIHHALLLSRL